MTSSQLQLAFNRQGAKQILQDFCLHPFNLQPVPAGDRLKLLTTRCHAQLSQPTLELLDPLLRFELVKLVRLFP